MFGEKTLPIYYLVHHYLVIQGLVQLLKILHSAAEMLPELVEHQLLKKVFVGVTQLQVQRFQALELLMVRTRVHTQVLFLV
jgi:hypothetical protein